MFIRLPSGRVVLLRELEHFLKYDSNPALDLIVDDGDIRSLGVETLVDEIVTALGIGVTCPPVSSPAKAGDPVTTNRRKGCSMAHAPWAGGDLGHHHLGPLGHLSRGRCGVHRHSDRIMQMR
jgi:hypothetical protein